MITLNSALPQFLVRPEPERYLRDDYVVFDFETTTHGKGLAVYTQNRVVGCCWRIGEGLRELAAQFGWEPNKSYYRRGCEYDFGDLFKFASRAGFLVAHNAKFDLQWAARCGLELENVLIYDTLLGEYVLGGNQYKFNRLGLDEVMRRRTGEGKIDFIKELWNAGIQTEDIPESWLERYCVRDVELTERLFLLQRNDLASLGLLPVQYARCLLTPVLADIEPNGMQLDPDVVRTTFAKTDEKFVELEKKLTEITGGINFNSRVQVAEYVYGKLGFAELRDRRGNVVKTPSGQPATDEDTLLSLSATSPQQREFKDVFVEYRGHYSQLSKYLRSMFACCEEAGGRLSAQFNQAATQTHRLSSNGLDYGMQFQNFPRQYKPLFKARHSGWLVGEVDGAQLEFRDAVHLGRDAVGLLDIVNGTDIHIVTASVIWPDENPKDRRQDAKPYTFKPLYGGRSGTPAEKRYYEFFRKKYEGISKWQQRNIDTVLNQGYLVTEWGLRFYWPGTRMDRSGYVTNSTAICNYPVQSHATAEIIPISLIWFWHRLKRSGLKMFIVNTIHDAILCEMPPEEVGAFHELSKQSLISDTYRTLFDLYGCRFTVPLGAGVKVASHWGGKDAGDFVPVGMVHDKGEVKYVADESLWKQAAQEAGMLPRAS